MMANIELLRGVVKFVKNDLGLEIHDSLPVNTKLPYVQIGTIETTSNRTKTHNGKTLLLTLHVWVRSTDSYDIHNMMEKLSEIEELDTLDVGEELSVDKIEIDFTHVLKEQVDNEIIYHGIMQIEFDISKN